MTRDEATALLAAVLHEVAPEVDLAAVDPDLPIQEVTDIDSLDFLQFVEILSETSGRRIEEDDYPELATLNSSIHFLSAR